jgi:hypothetical protein
MPGSRGKVGKSCCASHREGTGVKPPDCRPRHPGAMSALTPNAGIRPSPVRTNLIRGNDALPHTLLFLTLRFFPCVRTWSRTNRRIAEDRLPCWRASLISVTIFGSDMRRACAIFFRPFQKASSRLTLVLCPLINDGASVLSARGLVQVRRCKVRFYLGEININVQLFTRARLLNHVSAFLVSQDANKE